MMFPAAGGRDDREAQDREKKAKGDVPQLPASGHVPKTAKRVPAGNDGRDGRCCRCLALDHGRLARFLSPSLPCLELACLEDVLLC